jgi:hypothetical protein
MNTDLAIPGFRFGLAAMLMAFALAVSSVRADETPAGVMAFTVDVPAGKLSTKDVHDVVMAASIARGWGLKEDATEKVVIYLNHRKNEATVTYLISDKQVQAYCDGYATDGKGNRTGPKQPSGWLKYLREDITKNLTTKAVLAH